MPEGKHVMLSYHQNDFELVSEISNKMRNEKIKTWPEDFNNYIIEDR